MQISFYNKVATMFYPTIWQNANLDHTKKKLILSIDKGTSKELSYCT